MLKYFEIKKAFRYYIKQIDSMLPCIWYSNRSQKTSKCGKNISDTLGYATYLFLPHFDVICDLLLNRRTAIWNLFVKYTTLNHIRFVNYIIAKHVYTGPFAFSIVHDCSFVVVLILDRACPFCSACEMKCFCCITGTTIIHSVHGHDFESLWHWDELHITVGTATFDWVHFNYICWLK